MKDLMSRQASRGIPNWSKSLYCNVIRGLLRKDMIEAIPSDEYPIDCNASTMYFLFIWELYFLYHYVLLK